MQVLLSYCHLQQFRIEYAFVGNNIVGRDTAGGAGEGRGRVGVVVGIVFFYGKRIKN